jgi:hypothetical protein
MARSDLHHYMIGGRLYTLDTSVKPHGPEQISATECALIPSADPS